MSWTENFQEHRTQLIFEDKSMLEQDFKKLEEEREIFEKERKKHENMWEYIQK